MLGILLVVLLFVGGALAIVGVGYLAVRRHFHEIPLSRPNAIGISSLVTAGLLAAWLTLSLLGYALGQSLGNANLGTLIGGLVGITFWILTTASFGSRVTRSLAELQVMIHDYPQTPQIAGTRPPTLRVVLGAIFLVVVVFVAGAALAALNRSQGP
jgi:hypothetical protein